MFLSEMATGANGIDYYGACRRWGMFVGLEMSPSAIAPNAPHPKDTYQGRFAVRGGIAVIGVEPAIKYSFVQSGTQTRLKGQYNAELTLSPRLQVKPLVTAIRAIAHRKKNQSPSLAAISLTISQYFISLDALSRNLTT